MLALDAASRAQVDAAWQVALAHGGMDEALPDCVPSITRTITAPTFRDPDGNKLCVVCHLPVAPGLSISAD